MEKGLFITFEGVDGCGKTTQIELLKKYLDENKIQSIITREPGAGALGQKLREILLHFKDPISNKAELLMYLADRAQHVEFEIIPLLEQNKIVLCDRYIDSTLCYQGYARGVDIELIKQLNDIATGGLVPDLTIVFDIDIETAQQRLNGEKDRLEQEGADFHNKLREGYLEIARYEDRIKVINANDSIENIHNKVKEYVSELL